jgi:hypothetical protein
VQGPLAEALADLLAQVEQRKMQAGQFAATSRRRAGRRPAHVVG